VESENILSIVAIIISIICVVLTYLLNKRHSKIERYKKKQLAVYEQAIFHIIDICKNKENDFFPISALLELYGSEKVKTLSNNVEDNITSQKSKTEILNSFKGLQKQLVEEIRNNF